MEIPFLNKTKSKPGLCCIYLLPDSFIAACLVPQSDGLPLLQFIDAKPYSDPDSLKLALEALMKQYQLRDIPCALLLNPDSYQLVRMEKPGVEDNEIMQAVRWQIKKAVNFPAEDIVINYVNIPQFYKKDDKNEIYVCVANRLPMQKISDMLIEIGFDLQFIDIPEFALRNLNVLYGDEECYLGLLLLKPSGSLLVITHKKELLLTRSIPVSLELTEEVALEIQRCFVFCQNQQQEAMPKKLLVAPENAELISYLSSQLEIEAAALPMKTFMRCNDGALDNLSHDQIITIGGALRPEEKLHATN